MAANERPQRSPHLCALGGVAPEHVLEKQQIFLLDGGAAGEERSRPQHRERLAVATIRCDDLLAAELATKVGEAAQYGRRNRQLRGGVLQLDERGERERRRPRRRLRPEHPQEAEILLHVAEHEAQQKAIVERGELVFFRELVGSAEQRGQRDLLDRSPVVKETLVHER